MTSMPRSPATGSTGGADLEGRRLLQFAWISVALTPVAFVAAMVIGEGLLTLQGYDPNRVRSHRWASFCALPFRPVC